MSLAGRRVTIFAEGSHHTDAKRRRDSFDNLWHLLLEKVGVSHVKVVGFSKDQLVAVCPPPKFQGCRNLPLDLTLKLEYERDGFDTAIIALDLIPKHNAIAHHCRREEVERLLEGFGARGLLPPSLQQSAAALLQHYRLAWALGETPVTLRSPQALELLVMDPMFEALPLADEKGFRDALTLLTYPKEWPSFRLKGVKKPDREILLPAFACAPRDIRVRVDRGDKHQIAEYVLARLPADSIAWQHPMMERLRRLATL